MTLFGFGFWRSRGNTSSSGPRVIAGRLPQPHAGMDAAPCLRTTPEVGNPITVDIPGALEPDQYPTCTSAIPLVGDAVPQTGGQIPPCSPVPQNVISYNDRARGYLATRRSARAAK